MKNIHLLPTDKPSSLYYKDDNYKLANSTIAIDWYISSAGYKPTNIYITSDEEIKEGDWGLSKLNEIILFGRSYNEKFYKKIILTTDQDLIADGVQGIDDEFLEWFVKNPSCNNVEVEDFPTIEKYNSKGEYIHNSNWIYKIIIPQEEPKQESYICPHTKIQCDDECCVSAEDCHITSSLTSGMVDCDEPKQETLDEAANRLFYTVGNEGISSIDSFMKGANYQAERMYSEEDLREAFRQGENNVGYNSKYGYTFKLTEKEWFEQFKKK